MANIRRHKGFSLTEVLMAVGVMAVGMIFIAALFPVGHRLTNVAAERTIAAVVADEAFAKIKLYGIGDPANPDDGIQLGLLNTSQLINFRDTLPLTINYNEFIYPSADIEVSQRQYHWSALCRLVDARLVQVTIFVCRLTGAATEYRDRDPDNNPIPSGRPVPVFVNVVQGDSANELEIRDLIIDTVYEETFINDGYRIVDNVTGRIYQVIERDAQRPTTIILNQDWDPLSTPNRVWVIPPPAGGGRNPCIAVYQKVIRF